MLKSVGMCLVYNQLHGDLINKALSAYGHAAGCRHVGETVRFP